jgi:alpha-aminoadipate carrier protein LysW
MKMEVEMSSTYCPNCDTVLSVNNPQMSAMIECRECGQELEIISIDPLEVDFPLEDWEDDRED